MPFVSTVGGAIVANAALWLVVGAIAPVLTMLVVAESPADDWPRRIGLLNRYQGYGWAAGLVLGTVWPLVGGPLLSDAVILEWLFWFLAGCAVASTVLARWTLPRPERPATSDGEARSIARLLAATNRGIRGTTFAFAPNRLYWTTRGTHPRRLLDGIDRTLGIYLLAAGLFFTGFAVFWAPLPLYLTEVGFTTPGIFGMYLVASLASAVLYERVGAVSDRYHPGRLQSGALALRGVLFPAITLFAGLGALVVEIGTAGLWFAAIGATWAVIAVVGTAIVTRLARAGTRGDVLGGYTALAAVGGGLGGILGGWLAEYGYVLAFGVAGGLVLAGAGLILSLRGLSVRVEAAS